jgi:DNA-directed RNA polymerase specialized sigma24 family protein
MGDAASLGPMARDEDRRIAEVVEREGSRLRPFIRRRVGDPRDAEDVLQDVFSALVEANRLLMPIDHVTGWLFRVAHEFEGRSFKEMAAETGVSVNTLLSRKRYAVLHLRKRLQGVYDELAKG